jgi:anaerobic ribonucleoside-triphosphate reductase activating protein
MKIRLASAMQLDSIVDGPGLRCVIWTQGCLHNCKGCQNPQTHDFEAGFETTTEHIIEKLSEIKLQKGITFSGGDPFEQSDACAEIAKAAHTLNLDVWAYTGYTFEQLINSNRKDFMDFINEIDFLIDGPFILEQKSLALRFRGSKNQRIIDVKSSLELSEIICTI